MATFYCELLEARRLLSGSCTATGDAGGGSTSGLTAGALIVHASKPVTPSPTVGTYTGTILVNGIGTSAATLIITQVKSQLKAELKVPDFGLDLKKNISKPKADGSFSLSGSISGVSGKLTGNFTNLVNGMFDDLNGTFSGKVKKTALTGEFSFARSA
jgi:hypothetical protein